MQLIRPVPVIASRYSRFVPVPEKISIQITLPPPFYISPPYLVSVRLALCHLLTGLLAHLALSSGSLLTPAQQSELAYMALEQVGQVSWVQPVPN